MIDIDNITKTFNKKEVIKDVTLHIKSGTIFGLLGPNGAGKTTLIRMLCGITKSDYGSITINGVSIEKAKKDFAYVAQYFGQYEELSIWENLQFYAELYEVNDTKYLQNLLYQYDLFQFKHTFARDLSGGYKRRLALVCALAHNPSVLFLDEPTAGIDPVTRKQLWDDFYKLSQEGKTLFVTTHYMEEAQRCHELAFLASGKIVAQGTPQSIKNVLKNVQLYTVKLSYNPQVHEILKTCKEILLINQFADELRLITEENFKISILDKLLKDLYRDALVFTPSELNLEDIFIALTQEK